MKSNILPRILYILAAIMIVANTVFSVINSLIPNIDDLPEGEFISSFKSPAETSEVKFYLVKNNLGTAIRGEKVNGDKSTNIYWQTDIDTVSVQWLDEYGIVINDIPLNLKNDKFDCRRGTAIFSDGVTAEKVIENEQK